MATPNLAFASLAYAGPNLGDDIQSIAAEQFLPRVDYRFFREDQWAVADKAPAFYIANGWYSHGYNSLLPPPNLTPFYVAIHLRDRRMLTRAVCDQFRRFGPVGCRDMETYRALRDAGVDAYFSGCMTLTLQVAHFTDSTERGPVVISDLHEHFADLVPSALRDGAVELTHNTETGIIDQLAASGRDARNSRLVNRVDMKLQSLPGYQVTRSRLRRLIPRAHHLPDPETIEARYVDAKTLLRRFASARLVITSRLHCALPSLAFGTPVLMFHPNPEDQRFVGFEPYLKVHGPDTRRSDVDWNPAQVDISPLRNKLIDLATEAVRIGGNPLNPTTHPIPGQSRTA